LEPLITITVIIVVASTLHINPSYKPHILHITITTIHLHSSIVMCWGHIQGIIANSIAFEHSNLAFTTMYITPTQGIPITTMMFLGLHHHPSFLLLRLPLLLSLAYLMLIIQAVTVHIEDHSIANCSISNLLGTTTAATTTTMGHNTVATHSTAGNKH
jgi:hypothetical protein